MLARRAASRQPQRLASFFFSAPTSSSSRHASRPAVQLARTPPLGIAGWRAFSTSACAWQADHHQRSPAPSTPKSPHTQPAASQSTSATAPPPPQQQQQQQQQQQKASSDVASERALSDQEQTSRDWEIVRRLVPNIWPANDWHTKGRVLLAVALLVGGKLLNVQVSPRLPADQSQEREAETPTQVPFFFKSIVDTLNVTIDPATSQGVVAIAGTVIVGYGLARIGSTLFSELRNAVFANVAHGAIRRVARNVFRHLLSLDIGFHLSRQTGGLTRAIDRGTKCAPSLARGPRLDNSRTKKNAGASRSCSAASSSTSSRPRSRSRWCAAS